MPLFSRLITLVVFALLSASAFASERTWSDYSQYAALGPFVDYWQEPSGAKPSPQSVLSLPNNAWTPNHTSKVSLGYSDAAYWFRVKIQNKSKKEKHTLLEIAYPVLDYVDAYIVRDDQILNRFHLGDKRPFYDRPIYHPDFLIPVTLSTASQTSVYLRVDTTSSMQVPLGLWSQEAFYAADQPVQILTGMYYGIIIVMILYNLFVFMAVGERTFLYYIGFITAMPLFLASMHGLAFQYLWPSAIWWNDQAILFFLSLVLFFNAIFTKRFLSLTRASHPVMTWIVIIAALCAGVMAISSLFLPYDVLIVPLIATAAAGCLTVFIISVLRVWEGNLAARYYVVTWALMLFGGIMLALSKVGVMPRNIITENATQVGSALGVILLSIALADRLNREKKLAFRAQQQLFSEERKARQAQEKTLEVQREANVLLEHRVQERTHDLETLNKRLQELSATDALTGLKNRGHFDEAFRELCVKSYRYEQQISVLILDIDYFKRFNDTYGHLVGDDCLKMVADGICHYVTRPQDLAARYGGEEFVVLLPDTPAEGAVQVAENIRRRIEQTEFRVSEEMLRLTISIGVCCVVPVQADQTKGVFQCADEALYRAKNEGRNRVVLFGAN